MDAGVTEPTSNDPATMLRACLDAAVQAVMPERAMQRALEAIRPDSAPWIISIGKAGAGMARGLLGWVQAHDIAPAGGIVIGPRPEDRPVGGLITIAGDHPIPGTRSLQAADALRDVVASILPNASVHVAISGGTSSLMAAPLDALTQDDVTSTFATLLRSGLDIEQTNAVRKRVTRWSAGRLALALPGRSLRVWIISDVAGDDPGTVGSGPCTGDAWSSDAVIRMVHDSGIWNRITPTVRLALGRETPKPGDPILRTITPVIVAQNRTALVAAASAGRRFGLTPQIMPTPLTGEAATMGRTVAAALRDTVPGALLLWGGETTVTLGDQTGHGGRSQEVALAAAEVLDGASRSMALLAAGTDGEDGPTDAAGGVVDGGTWQRISAAGRDPAGDLARHESYSALAAAGALVTTGPTGTNVADLAMAVNAPPRARRS